MDGARQGSEYSAGIGTARVLLSSWIGCGQHQRSVLRLTLRGRRHIHPSATVHALPGRNDHGPGQPTQGFKHELPGRGIDCKYPRCELATAVCWALKDCPKERQVLLRSERHKTQMWLSQPVRRNLARHDCRNIRAVEPLLRKRNSFVRTAHRMGRHNFGLERQATDSVFRDQRNVNHITARGISIGRTPVATSIDLNAAVRA